MDFEIRVFLSILLLALISACSETQLVAPLDVGSERLPLFYSTTSSLSSSESLNCILREVALENSNNSFEHSSTNDGWIVLIIYGSSGIVGGRQVGEIRGNSGTLDFYYRPAIGNLGLDAWNVESVIPRAMNNCS